MVTKGLLGLMFGLATGPVWAGGLLDDLFPGKSGCYARSYSNTHLAKHPDQLVTDISVAAEADIADPQIGLWLDLVLRGDIAGSYESFAVCENAGSRLECHMEGDAGNFSISAADDGAILIEVGRFGMSFEAEVDYITLMPDQGDDRSFVLAAVPCR